MDMFIRGRSDDAKRRATARRPVAHDATARHSATVDAAMSRSTALRFLGLGALLLVLAGACATVPGVTGSSDEFVPEGPVAPARGTPAVSVEEEEEPEGLRSVEFPTGVDWINTAGPLTMEGLRGRYVLLDFWTYGCINCYHMVPHLNELHRRYEDHLIVVGVHSAKFSTESETENIRQAVQRYEIEYPVLNDAEMVLWQAYYVPGWPTLLLIGPDGEIIGGHAGEWPLEMMTVTMDRLIAGDPGAAPPLPEELAAAGRPHLPPTVLRYPEGVFLDENTQDLFIADTGNHRIIAVDPESGTVRAVYGDGTAGFSDGIGPAARFRRPRGIARLGEALYVADTGNHAIRRINPADGTVTTVVRGSLTDFDGLRSPWGLAVFDDHLYIANAGEHQIWRLDPSAETTTLFAGTGHEGIVDGNREEAEFAQPSGLHVAGDTLWVADPESSAIRRISLREGTVTTVIGTGLFDFGDRDGPVEEALLMHAADVAAAEGVTFVLDTYNSKVKRIVNKMVHTLEVEGLDEPKAFALGNDELWIADTNNHRIVTVSTGGGEPVPLRLSPQDSTAARTITARQHLAEDNLELSLLLPEGYKLNEASPNTAAFLRPDGTEFVHRIESTAVEHERVVIPWSDIIEAGILDTESPRQSVRVELWLYYCEQEDEQVCLFDGGVYTVAVEQAPTVQGNALVTHRVGESNR